MNLELVRLLRYEVTDEFREEFKDLMVASAKKRDPNGTATDLAIEVIDQIHMLPDKQLRAWFRKRKDKNWENILNCMLAAISDYIRFRQLSDGGWTIGNTAI